MNGHADIVGGVIVVKQRKLDSILRPMMINLGCNMDPHQAYMVIRGLKTLSVRMEKAQQNAIKVARFLEVHPKVAWVKYPGLESHPQYELARSQMDGPGAMISFEMKGGLNAGKNLMNKVSLPLLAVSLGGVESLIQHPASMTHSKVDKSSREESGITDGLVRFSVGIENPEDIITDLERAMENV